NMAPQPFADLEDNHLVIGMETKRMASLWENQLDNSLLNALIPSDTRNPGSRRTIPQILPPYPAFLQLPASGNPLS
ncbi:hypothetical protein, partial [Parasphingorhabdus sp.]|uniref:hypothetical protein n=1 Tax=Parasphingorhabdus sp. TaxID=2709688 RepID=UPI0039E31BB4